MVLCNFFSSLGVPYRAPPPRVCRAPKRARESAPREDPRPGFGLAWLGSAWVWLALRIEPSERSGARLVIPRNYEGSPRISLGFPRISVILLGFPRISIDFTRIS